MLFILRRPGFSLAAGIEDCQRKFGWPGLTYLLQTAFLRAGSFRGWVDTDPPVSLDEARAFFRELARSLIQVGGAGPA